MPKQDIDLEGQWTLDQSGATWTLTENTTIHAVGAGNGISDETGDNLIAVFGHIFATRDGRGVQLGQGSTLLIGQSGWIEGPRVAIDADEPGARIVNHGHVQGDYTITLAGGVVRNQGTIISAGGSTLSPGITSTGFVRVMNEGLVSGKFAVDGDEGGIVFNGKDGVITGNNYAVDFGLTDGKTSEIENHGMIRGRDYSIYSEGETSIVNHGTILGDIELDGDHDDRIDLRDGVFRGTVRGGEGDDTYLISSPLTKIIDTGLSAGDTVRSTVTYVLPSGLDHLYLLGNKPTMGQGNAGNNRLVGSDAINSLFGESGNDILSGEGGKDLLSGGTGQDQFWFFKGFGVDTIEDFEDGQDLIILPDAWMKIPFGKLDIEQKGGDVVIDFGHGDRLILQDVEKGDLSRNDFSAAD